MRRSLRRCDTHSWAARMELGAGGLIMCVTLYIGCDANSATICVADHATQIMSGLSASKPLASDRCATQIGASHLMQIALSVLVIHSGIFEGRI